MALELVIILIPLAILFYVSLRSSSTNSLRIVNRKLQSDDNEEFKNMLLDQGEIKICEKVKIDMNSWSVITPTVSKIVGDGDNAVLEITPNAYSEIRLFEKLVNIEIINLHIKISSIGNNGKVYINKGITNEILNSTINGLHICIADKNVIIQVKGGKSSILSNTITSSVLNDVGISFDDMDITYTDSYNSQLFSLISNTITSDNRVTWNGIYIKGGNINIHTASVLTCNGIMFTTIENIDFNYVVIDIDSISFDVKGDIFYALFMNRSNSEITLNNSLIIVRSSFRYTDYDEMVTDSYFSMISILANKGLTINHCLIDVRFGDLILNWAKHDTFTGGDKLKRYLSISSVVCRALDNLKLVANYLQVRFHFEKDCVSKKKNCALIYGNHCKSICEPSLLSTEYKEGSISLNNSYFYLDKAFSASIEPYFISVSKVGIVSDESYITTNGNSLIDGTHSIIAGDVLSIYPSMKSLGYSRYGSIIYYTDLPFYDFQLNVINYEKFENVTPKYENVCDITTPDLTTTTTVETAVTTTPPPPTTTPAKEEITTTPSIPTTTLEQLTTTVIDVEITDEDEQFNQSNKISSNEDSSALLISLVTVGSIIVLGCSSLMIFYGYKHELCKNRRISPETSEESSIEMTSDENTGESGENLIIRE